MQTYKMIALFHLTSLHPMYGLAKLVEDEITLLKLKYSYARSYSTTTYQNLNQPTSNTVKQHSQ